MYFIFTDNYLNPWFLYGHALPCCLKYVLKIYSKISMNLTFVQTFNPPVLMLNNPVIQRSISPVAALLNSYERKKSVHLRESASSVPDFSTTRLALQNFLNFWHNGEHLERVLSKKQTNYFKILNGHSPLGLFRTNVNKQTQTLKQTRKLNRLTIKLYATENS